MKILLPLTAAATDGLVAVDNNWTVTAKQEPRTITGMVAPYNEYGMTSAGKVKFLPGSIRLPDDLSRIKLLDHHTGDGTAPEPVGVAIAALDTPEGLVLTFKIATTSLGDDALTGALEKTKDSFSVELIDVDLHRDEVRDSALTAVAQVPVPAFASAQAISVAAALHPQTTSTTQEDTMKMTDEQRARLAALRGQATLTQADAAELVTLAQMEAAEQAEAEAAEAAEREAAEAAEREAAEAAEESSSDQAPATPTVEVAAAHAPATLTASTSAGARKNTMKAKTLFATMARVATG